MRRHLVAGNASNPYAPSGLFDKQLQLAPSTVVGFGDSIVQYNFIGGLSFTGVWSSAISSIANGGSGYAIDDTVNLGNGVLLQVRAVSSGAITSATFTNWGSIASAPSNPVAQVSTSGAGTGATFNLTWTSFSSSLPPAAAQITSGVLPAAAWSLDYGEWECPGGVGVLNFDGTNLTWAPNGLSAGAAVDATQSGKLYIPGPAANQGLWINWFVGRGTYSATAMSVDIQANGFQLYVYQANGHIVNALAQTNQALRMATDSNVLRGRKAFYGLGGASSTDFVAASWQWTQIVGDIYVEGLGTNDIGGSVVPATIIANRTTVWDWVVGQGKILIIEELPPRLSESSTQMEYRHKVNQAAYSYSQNNPRVYFSARGRYLQDPASTSGNFMLSSPALSIDGIHPNGLGGYRGAIPLASIFTALKPGSLYRTNYGDIYDATNNPGGNLLSAGMGVWNGTSGTASATGMSGSLATGWTIARGSGTNITAACSKVARTDGIPGDWQQVILGGALGNEYVQITRSAGVMLAAAGSVIEAVLEVVVLESSGLNIIDVILQPNVVSARAGQAFGTLGGDPIAGQKFFLKIYDWPVPATATGFAAYVRLGIQNGGSATILLGDVYFRKVG